MANLMDYLLLAIGVYVLIGGIRGKGKLFQMDFLKEGYEEKFKKTLRSIYIPMGIVMLINGAVSLVKAAYYEQVPVTAADGSVTAYEWALKEGKELGELSFMTPEFFMILTYICMGLVVALVVLLIVMMRKMTDKEAQKKASQAGGPGARSRDPRQGGHVLPVSAFEFDEPEPEEEANK